MVMYLQGTDVKEDRGRRWVPLNSSFDHSQGTFLKFTKSYGYVFLVRALIRFLNSQQRERLEGWSSSWIQEIPEILEFRIKIFYNVGPKVLQSGVV